MIIESENDLVYLPQDYEKDSITSIRDNQGVSIKDYDQQLLDLCVAAKLRILNDRTGGDFQGQITYIGDKGHSKVDLVFAFESASYNQV